MSRHLAVVSSQPARQFVRLADDLETLITIHTIARRAYEEACEAFTPWEEEWYAARRLNANASKSRGYRAAERWMSKTSDVETAASNRLMAYRPKTIQEVRRRADYIFSVPLIWECATQEEFCTLIRSMTSMDA